MARLATAVWWVLAITYPICLALAIIAWLGEPYIGVDASPTGDNEMVITWVQPGGAAWVAGAQVGDVLLEVDGTAVDQDTWQRTGDSGTAFSILTASEGRLISDRIGTEWLFSGPLVTGLVSISLVFAVVSLCIFLRSIRSNEILVVCVLFLAGAIILSLSPAGARGSPLAMHVVALSIGWTSTLFFIYFSLLYHPGNRYWPTLGAVLRNSMVAWVLALDLMYVLSVTTFPGIYEGTKQVMFVQLAVGLMGGVALLFLTYVGTNSSVVREQLRIMVFGITAAVVPFVVLSLTPLMLSGTSIVRPEAAILSIILVPLSFAYAVMRHQLMGIRRLVHRGAAYALITAVIFTIYGGLIAILRVAGGTEVSGNLSLQILLLLVLFAAIPFISGTRRLAFQVVDRLLYREYVDHPDLARRVSINAANAQHLDDLAKTVLGTMIRELRLSFAAFLEVSDGVTNVKASAGQVPGELTERIETVAADTAEQPVSHSRMAIENSGDQVIVVTLRRKLQEAAVLCLGPKISEEEFNREDLELAQSIAGQVATIVDKLELNQELKEKAAELSELNRRLVGTQEAERARIASYLHDETLQQITSMVWRHGRKGLTPKIQDDIQNIAEGLRNFAARLHPGLLQDLGLVRALEWTGSEAEALSGIRLVFESGDIERDERLDPDIELALYRIAQEALTNCQRHSNATTVWIRLERSDDRVTMHVEDDGIGLSSFEESRSTARLGIIGMRERAEQLGGNLRVSARFPSGTSVVATTPVHGKDKTGFIDRQDDDD